ncbi:AAA family ATPase, partial [Candidatus Roizmanbacteria bacterium]|nr:AAA family ATPase [Candidatus Roizmanbacteria bacterium]
VLLEEIEKSHHEVFNNQLKIHDYCRLTDNKGRTISFKNTILICTSNIGTGLIQKTLIDEMQVGELHVQKKEDTTLSTVVVTPTGRMIVTRGKDCWQMDKSQKSGQATWSKKPLSDYFAGQKLQNFDALSQDQKFPAEGFDTHVVLPSGAEVISVEDRLWQRTSTTAKEWNTISLIDYFKGHSVANAEPDVPEQQLPTATWETHAVSPSEKEVISLDGRIWVRESQQETTWKTFTKEEYLSQNQAASAQKPAGSVPAQSVQPSQDARQPAVYSSSELTKAQNATPSAAPQPDVKTSETKQEISDQAAEMPSTKAWDSHVFTPAGDEMIVVGSTVWKRMQNQPWLKQELSELLAGESAPVVAKKDEPSKEDAAFESKFMMLTEQLLEELRKFFKPELLNRFDEIIVFRPLTAQHMLAIVDLQIESLRQMLEEQELGIEVSDAVKEELTVVGFDPIFGARPLRRTIQRLIENPVSTMLIKGDLKEGDTVVIDFDSETNDFVFTTRRPAPASPTATAVSGELAPVDQPEVAPKGTQTPPSGTANTVDTSSPSETGDTPDKTPPAGGTPPATGGLTMNISQKDASLSAAMDSGAGTDIPPMTLQADGTPVVPTQETPASANQTETALPASAQKGPASPSLGGPVSPVSEPMSPPTTTELPSIPHFNNGLSTGAPLATPSSASPVSAGGTHMQKAS